MFVKLVVFFNKTGDFLLVDWWFSVDPLSLPESIFNVVGAWGRSINLGDFVRRSVIILFTLDELQFKSSGFVGLLKKY